jgi:hypothetical protein
MGNSKWRGAKIDRFHREKKKKTHVEIRNESSVAWRRVAQVLALQTARGAKEPDELEQSGQKIW